MPYLGLAVGVGVLVVAGVGAVVAAGLDPVGGASVGSPVAAGVLVVPAPAPAPSPPPLQAPRIVARLNIKAKPKIFVFITPLSPIVARTIFRLLNTIPYLLLFFKAARLHN